jgi:hypothetical protein
MEGRLMRFHPDVLAAHAQFGGDLESMQKLYDHHDCEATIATLRAENEQLRRERDAIRNETLEEAAKVAEQRYTRETVRKSSSGEPYAAGKMAIFAAITIAQSLRNLKEPSDV